MIFASSPSNLHKNKMAAKTINLDIKNAQSVYFIPKCIILGMEICYVQSISYPEDIYFHLTI